MTPKEKAFEIVADYCEIIPVGDNFNTHYEIAKISAMYAANKAKWSHESGTKKWKYWKEIEQEIKKL